MTKKCYQTVYGLKLLSFELVVYRKKVEYFWGFDPKTKNNQSQVTFKQKSVIISRDKQKWPKKYLFEYKFSSVNTYFLKMLRYQIP